MDWRSYGLSMSKGALPSGPMVLMAHIASVWVPFTSESKEAIAHYPEIVKELRLALMEAGRKLSSHIRHRRRAEAEAKKKSYIDKFIPHIGIALKDILGLSDRDEQKVVDTLKQTLERSREHMVSVRRLLATATILTALAAPAAPLEAPVSSGPAVSPAQLGPATGPVATLPAARVEAIEVVVANQMARLGVPGLSVAVASGRARLRQRVRVCRHRELRLRQGGHRLPSGVGLETADRGRRAAARRAGGARSRRPRPRELPCVSREALAGDRAAAAEPSRGGPA